MSPSHHQESLNIGARTFCEKFWGNKWLVVSVVGVISFLVAIPIHILLLDLIFVTAEPRSEILGFEPAMETVRAEPEVQQEPHTCGVHTMRSLYRAHKLNPDEHNLRFRLGADIPAFTALASSTGIVQPDLCRVLAQDGFHVRVTDPEDTSANQQLVNHLAAGWKCVALIRRPQNGHLHWVLVQSSSAEPGIGADLKTVELVDSLEFDPVVVDLSEFLRFQAVTLIFPEPSGASEPSIRKAYRQGIRALRNTPDRMKLLNARASQAALP